MKISRIIILLLFLSNSLILSQNSIQIERFEKKDIIIGKKVENDSIYHEIRFANFSSISQPGKPELPIKYVKILIPYDQDPESIVLQSLHQQKMEEQYKLRPVKNNPAQESLKDHTYAQPFELYPKNPVEIIRHGYFDGVNHIVTLAIYPFQYINGTKELLFNDIIEYKIQTKSNSKASYPRTRKAKVQRIYDKSLYEMIGNKDDIEAYKSNTTLVEGDDKSISMLIEPPILPIYEYIIITSPELKSSFNEFVYWKKSKGLQAGVVTTTEIYQNYSGPDNAAKIKAYLHEAYYNPFGYGYTGPVWILLAGTPQIVPIRYCYNINIDPPVSNINKVNEIPSDLYYSDLTGSWDTDNDGYYGEYSDDNVDFEPELFVGRLLCRQSSDILNWTKKVIQYEQNPGNGDYAYLKKSFIYQADDFQNDNQAQSIKDKLLSFTHDVWQEDNIEEPSEHRAKDVISKLNQKYGIISFLTHSSAFALVPMSYIVKDENGDYVKTRRWNINPLDSDDLEINKMGEDSESGDGIDNLTNSAYPSILIANGCNNIQFDNIDFAGLTYLSMNIGQAFTNLPNSGGPAVIGYTRNAGIRESRYIYEKFCEAITGNSPYIGIADATTRTFSDHGNVLSHNLIGCPETPVWTGIPNKFTNVSVSYNAGSLNISSGVAGAKICVMSLDNGQSFYETYETNCAVQTNISPLRITITKNGYIPYIYITNEEIIANKVWSGEKFIGTVTVHSGATLTIQPGATIKLGVGANIIVEPGGKIVAAGTQTNPIRFERAVSNERWGIVELRGDGNQFTYCLFDGGNYDMLVRSRNNTFTNCTFKNANRGISTYTCYNNTANWSSYKLTNCLVTNNVLGVVSSKSYGAITGTEIKNNSSYGLYVTYSRLGLNSGYGGLFTKNYIHDNGTYGVQLDYDSQLWLGYGTTKGQNRICNNGSHEVYINGNYAYLYQSSIVENSSTGSGHSDIYDEGANNYLIYNLAKTYDGETYISIQQIAENNFWNTCGAPSTWMYGPVDITPYKEAFQGVITSPTVPLNIESKSAESAPQILTANMVAVVSENAASETKSGLLLEIKQRMLDIRNEMKKNPSDPANARRMNEIFGLIGVIGKDKAAEDIISLNQFMSERKTYFASNAKSATAKENLLGETAMVLEVAEKVRDKKYAEALSLAAQYDSSIKNADNRRDLLSHKIAALEGLENYEGALEEISNLKEVVKDDLNNGYYTAPTYEIIEEDLLRALGKETESVNKNIVANVTEKAKEKEIPESFNLFQNYPNPFNPSTTIKFSLPEASKVKMEVFDITGRLIDVLADGNYEAGNYQFTFNGKHLASGIYIVRANLMSLENSGSNHIFTRKLMLLK